MEINSKIKKYLDYIESKSDRELTLVIAALEGCQYCESDRLSFYRCLLNRGLNQQQIGIIEGISRQAVHDFLNKADPLKRLN